jgi:BarA-like signal transduction histidine kinase
MVSAHTHTHTHTHCAPPALLVRVFDLNSFKKMGDSLAASAFAMTRRSLNVARIALFLLVVCQPVSVMILCSGKPLVNDRPCALYLHQSAVKGAGRGMIAGKDYTEDAFVLGTPTLLVPSSYSDNCQLDNYVFRCRDPDAQQYHELPLSYVAVVNHRNIPTTGRHNVIDNVTISFSPYGSATTTEQLRTLVEVKAGDELFVTYGDTWFKTHSMAYLESESARIPLKQLQTTGFCVSDVEIRDSEIPLAGMGLFARKKFSKGDVVAVDPALTIPTRKWAQLDTEMVNYCISKPGSSVGLLPLGVAIMANHRSAPGANVKMDWYDWGPAANLSEALELPVKDLLKSKFSRLDIRLVALRDIDPNEEILVDYGSAWLQLWADFVATDFEATSTDIRTFRHYIEAPDDMFPGHWFESKVKQPSCDVYLHRSTIPGAGRGTIAGRDFDSDEFVLSTPAISISKEYSNSTQLKYYVFGSLDPEYHELPLNYVAVINHHAEPTITRHSLFDHTTIPFSPFGSATVHEQLRTSSEIKAGDELFVTYGDDWFPTHSIEYQQAESARVSPETLQATGYCLTDTEIRDSKVPLAGKGLFARKAFAQGDVVAIDPVLALPTAQWPQLNTEMINYCISKPGSTVGLLPLGVAIMANHRSAPGANAKMDWFDWGHAANLSEALELPVKDLLKSKFSRLDIRLVALRDIDPNEEILVDYGSAWIQAWADFVAAKKTTDPQQCFSTKECTSDASWFRHYIEAPDGLFPRHWFD